jgi:type I restriction-modification system, S subunit, putative
MTPEELKISIFHYAMQGKLVEQREEDGTANDLYCEIIKIAKKDKNITPITDDEIPFDIPSSWRWCKFGEIVDCSMGKTPPRAEAIWWDNDVPWVSISDMTDYGHVKETKEKVSKKAADEKFGDISKAGTLLMSFKLTVGRTSILDIDALHNEAIISIYPYVDKNNYLRDYLFYILPIITQWGDSKNAIMGKTLNSKSIANLRIPLAPLNELHRIVAKIEELLPLVDRYAASYEKLEQFNAKFPEDMKKSILQYAIQGKLVEQRPEEGSAEELYKAIQEEKQKLIKEGKLKKTRALPLITEEEIPFDFPKTWKICYIDDIAFVTKLAGFEYTKYIADNLVIDGIPLFKGKNVQNGKLVLEFESFIPESVSDELPRSQITKKCLLTPYVGTIGNIAIFDGTFKAHLGSNVGKIEILNSNDNTFVLEEYLLWYLRSQYGYNELTKYKKATAQESISIDAIRNVIIAIPPLEEQHRIVAKIEELLSYCDRLVKRC